MGWIDYGIIALVLLILGCAVLAIRKAKKKGQKCIGCPCSGQCSGRCGGK